MGRFADVQAFVREANQVREVSSLKGLLDGAAETLGFDYYSLVHHASGALAGRGTVRIVDYPESWVDVIRTRGYYADDPVLVASEKSVTAFDWSDLAAIIDLTPKHQEFMDTWAKQAGMGGGFTIPVRIPGEYAGSCSFGTRSGRPLPVEAFPAAQYIGCFAFEAARRVMQKDRSQAVEDWLPFQPLTQRQFDCVVMIARGKSDWDAGRILGISDQTVHKHIEEAKRRYGVATRVQLVVRALFKSHLTFADVLN
jgi:LuxR family quorum-sensing system transcriptional regulator CciR